MTCTWPNVPLFAPRGRSRSNSANSAGSTRFSQCAASFSISAGGIPIGATMISPAWSQVGERASSTFGAENVTV